MSYATWMEDDVAQVSAALTGWSPTPAPVGWAGTWGPNDLVSPEPELSADSANPTQFIVWALDYDNLDGTYEGVDAPIRQGRLRIAFYCEPGTGHAALAVYGALLVMIRALADAPLCFRPDEAAPVRVGQRGPWWVQELVIPFTGC